MGGFARLDLTQVLSLALLFLASLGSSSAQARFDISAGSNPSAPGGESYCAKRAARSDTRSSDLSLTYLLQEVRELADHLVLQGHEMLGSTVRSGSAAEYGGLAMKFLVANRPSVRLYRHGDGTWAKLDVESGELLIASGGKIQLYMKVKPQRFGFESLQQVFDAIRIAELRTGASALMPSPFNRVTLYTHHGNHGQAFGAETPEEYGAMAVAFAKEAHPDALVWDIEDTEGKKTMKVRLSTDVFCASLDFPEEMVTFFSARGNPYARFMTKLRQALS